MEQPDDWNVGGIINPDPVEPSRVPQVISLAGLVLIQRHVEAMLPTDEGLAVRMGKVRALRAEVVAEALREAGDEDFAPDAKPEDVVRQVSGRLPEGVCIALLLSAVTDNPFDPYDIRVSKDVRARVNQGFARDLGVPASWADEAEKSVWATKKSFRRSISPLGVITTALGLGTIIAVLPLAVAFAPVGLVGGAVFMSSLATLGGSFGLMGGIAVISSLAALGGGATASGVSMLVSGSSAEVQQRVLTLVALAIAKKTLRPGTAVTEPELIESMHVELAAETQVREGIDDKNSPGMREAAAKLKALEVALKVLTKRSIA